MNLNEVTDIDNWIEQACKKSVEFFLGKRVEDKVKERKDILPYLEKNNLYLRQAAIDKKYTEYFIGKEFSGLFKNCSLTKEISSNEKIESTLSPELNSFLSKKLKIKIIP